MTFEDEIVELITQFINEKQWSRAVFVGLGSAVVPRRVIQDCPNVVGVVISNNKNFSGAQNKSNNLTIHLKEDVSTVTHLVRDNSKHFILLDLERTPLDGETITKWSQKVKEGGMIFGTGSCDPTVKLVLTQMLPGVTFLENGLWYRVRNVKSLFKTFYIDNPQFHTPTVDISFNESLEKYVSCQCNNQHVLYTNMPEVSGIEDILSEINPTKVLEIGCGIGRGTVYMKKRYGWDDTDFFMLDGNVGETQISPIDGDGKLDFYNSLDATRMFCTENGILTEKVHTLDAGANWRGELDGVKFDLVCSYLAIGFHWSVERYLNQLIPFCHKDTVLVFGTRGTDRGSEFTQKQLSYVERHSFYKVIRNVAESELLRSSVLVLGVK